MQGVECDVSTELSDQFDWLVMKNIERFGADSYFSDHRFREGFRDMLNLLAGQGMLRVTTMRQGHRIIAVDAGSIYRQQYTLLAGATDRDVPGIAKLINLRHLQWGCQAQLREVDFLCGDFSWKPLFHLTPRPLHLLELTGNN